MIFMDFEVFKHDWMIVFLDTKTKQYYNIVNNTERFKAFYDKYKTDIWVAYNGNGYDTWIAKAILAGFHPYDMSDWIINKGQKGYAFSQLLNKFPIYMYNVSVGFRSLKEIEAFMGGSIKETTVSFDIDRPLTKEEIRESLDYCKHDVKSLFEVFVETKHEFESHTGLIKEFKLPWSMISKTKAQMSAEILGAIPKKRVDEFDITIPDNMLLGKYEFIREHFYNWSKNSKNYEEISLSTEICGVQHDFGVGGIHGAIPNYYGTGLYLMVDVALTQWCN